LPKLHTIWKDNQTKCKLVETFVLSIALDGAETWTLKATDFAQLDSFEMWVWRRLLRIPWTAHRTNVSISEGKDDKLEKLVIQEKTEGN